DGFGWLFFLWDKVSQEYAGETYPVRLDKIANATIKWDEKFLAEMTERRLAHFSDRAVQTFAQLCEPDVSAHNVFLDAIRMSMRSPRELIRILDTVVREHDDEFAHLASSPRLVQTSIDRALDKYALDAVARMFDPLHLQQLGRLKLVTFINKDVQQAFRINDQSARQRIRTWVDAGLASQTGTRQAEGGAGGKPSHEYSVTDLRVKRLLTREVPLGPTAEDEGGEQPTD